MRATITPTSWLCWDFTVRERGLPVADARLSWFGPRGHIRAAGEQYDIDREGLWFGAFLLSRGDSVVARAVKPSAFVRAFRVTIGDGEYALEAERVLLRRFVLRAGREVIGFVAPEHAFTRRATAELPDSLLLPGRVFLMWLVVYLWRRAAQSS